MDGTQIPKKIAAVASPLKYKVSEKISERKAATNNNLSVMVNLLSIIICFGYKHKNKRISWH